MGWKVKFWFLGRGIALLVLRIACQAQSALARRAPEGGANAFGCSAATITRPLRACTGSRVRVEVHKMAGTGCLGLRLLFFK